MEIISYVGSSSAGSFRPGKTSKTLRSFKARVKEIEIPQIVVPKINLRVLKPAKIIFLFVVATVCIFTSFIVLKAMVHFESYTGPVKMTVKYDSETDFLREAMSKFAMTPNNAAFDENGNLLTADGKVITAAGLGIAKAVSYQTYKVKSGDTISSVALKFGLTNISTLIAVNGIDNVRTLRAGQKLRIPNQDGLTYTVAGGDSINSVSAKFGITMESLLDVNDLSSRNLSVGQELFIPGARMDTASLKKAMGELFICPLAPGYRITSRFGRRSDPFTGVPSNHTGVDMAAPSGTPIKAAMSGKIAYVGWSNIFGNYVIINHGNGYQTLYGHMQKALCRTGQTVSQGTRIGLVGSTGYSTGPHLHLTMYKNGTLMDPLSVIKR